MELLMSEEVRPFEEYKEMIKDMRKEEMIKGLYDLSANIMEKQKEIERLNNIINELEKWVEEDEEKAMNNFECGRCFNMYHILDKIKELRGDKE